MKYPKIHSLWKRVEMKGELIEGDYAIPEFGNIKKWRVQEKIDGTNIRIEYTTTQEYGVTLINISFKGRTDEAMLPRHLDDYLRSYFTKEKLSSIIKPQDEHTDKTIILFGEGYGPKIQSVGGNYRSDVGFILFDMWCSGWWLKQEAVKDIAEQLGIPYAPEIGIMTEEEIVDYVKSKPLSLCSNVPQMMEGVVCRPPDLLLLRNGDPVIMKLKCKEFIDGHLL